MQVPDKFLEVHGYEVARQPADVTFFDIGFCTSSTKKI